MHEPANAPVELTFHDEAMKHESIVYQFQSICRLNVSMPVYWAACEVGQLTEILQPLPPPIPLMPVAAAAADAVDVAMDMPVAALPWSIVNCECRPDWCVMMTGKEL